jgi:hypothetical protein
MLIFLVGFLNPGFQHPVLSALSFSHGWEVIIDEYQSIAMYKGVPAIYVLAVIAMFTLVALVRLRRFGLVLACLLLGYKSIELSRLVTPAGIVFLCSFALVVYELDFQRRLKAASRNLLLFGGILTGLAVLVAIVSSVNIARSFMEENRNIPTLFPEDIVNYMLNEHIRGKIFNPYGIGGYLGYRLSPNSQTYVDGRANILFPLEHVEKALLAEKSAPILGQEIRKYDIDLAILSNRHDSFIAAQESGLLVLEFVGNRYSLYKRSEAKLPLLGLILAYPACWNESMTTGIEREWALAREVLPPNSFLRPSLINSVVEYASSNNRREWLSSLQYERVWYGPELRFLAYQALYNDLNYLAYELLDRIPNKSFSDYIAAALAMSRLGEWGGAEHTLDLGTRSTASYSPAEIRVLFQLLNSIKKNATLNLFAESYLQQIKMSLDSSFDNIPSGLPELQDFCPIEATL